MPRRATGLESGGVTGFRRLGFKNAVNPRDLRALLDPQGDDAPFSLERLTKQQQAALANLDGLATHLFLRTAEERPCEKEVQFALGLDKQDKIERLRAIVARAFRRADSYAKALAQLFEDARDAEQFSSQLDAFFKIVGAGEETPFYKGSPYRGLAKESAPYRAIEILNRRRLESATEKEGRRDDITHGLAALDSMRRELRFIADGSHLPGAKPDDARFFFVLRLAEVFVIWTGRSPDFDFQEGEKGRKKNTEWIELSTNALMLCGLGVSGRDGLFKRLGGKGPRGKAYEASADYRDLVDSLAQALGPCVETTETIIEWELEPPNIKRDRPTQDLCERLHEELKKRDMAFEQLRNLHDAASKNPIEAEARLSYTLRSFPTELAEQGRDAPEEAPMPRLTQRFYSCGSAFAGGDLPSSGWLTDFQLTPEPSGYDDGD